MRARRSPVSVIGRAVISTSPSAPPLHVQGQLRVGAQIRVPGAPARVTAEKDPSVGVPEPDLDAAGGARFASVRGDVDNGMLLDGRAES